MTDSTPRSDPAAPPAALAEGFRQPAGADALSGSGTAPTHCVILSAAKDLSADGLGRRRRYRRARGPASRSFDSGRAPSAQDDKSEGERSHSSPPPPPSRGQARGQEGRAQGVRHLRQRAGALALAVLLAAPAGAQSRVGTTAAPFLTMNTTARTTALGGASTAYVTGAGALFWNPGGATSAGTAGEGGLVLTHETLFADITHDAGALVLPVGPGVVGLHAVTVDYGRVDVTTEFDEDTGETYGASDLAAGLSYAVPLTDRFTFGGTVKYVRQSVRDMTAQSAAVDIGFVLETPYLGGARLAAAIRNFGGKLQMEGINSRVFVDPDPTNSGNNDQIPAAYEISAWNLPLSFKLGVAVPAVRAGGGELWLLADVEQVNDFDLNGDFGAEARYALGGVALAARAGYQNLTADPDAVDAHVAVGGGLEVQAGGIRLGADVAYVPFNYLGSTQLIDLRVTF